MESSFTHTTPNGQAFYIYQMTDNLQRHANEKGAYAAYSYYFAVYPNEPASERDDEYWSVACVFTHSLLTLWNRVLGDDFDKSILKDLAKERLLFALDVGDNSKELWFSSENTLGRTKQIPTPQNILSEIKQRIFQRQTPQIIKKIKEVFDRVQKTSIDGKGRSLFQDMDERIWGDIARDTYSPKDFIYQINALCLAIDAMAWTERIKKPLSDGQYGSIMSFRQYLDENNLPIDGVIDRLQAIKNIRKQYPIHLGTEHRLPEAEKTLGITNGDNWPEKWRKVLENFFSVLEFIEKMNK